MIKSNIEIFKAAYELLKICDDILGEERDQNINAKTELSELDRQYRRYLIDYATSVAKINPRNYPQ